MIGMRVSRRRLVLTAFAGAASLIGGAYHWRRLRRPKVSDITALIEQRLAHLDLDAAGVQRFAEEYDRRFGVFSMSVHHRDTLGGILRIDTVRSLLPQRRQQGILELERIVQTRPYLRGAVTVHETNMGHMAQMLPFAGL